MATTIVPLVTTDVGRTLAIAIANAILTDTGMFGVWEQCPPIALGLAFLIQITPMLLPFCSPALVCVSYKRSHNSKKPNRSSVMCHTLNAGAETETATGTEAETVVEIETIAEALGACFGGTNH